MKYWTNQIMSIVINKTNSVDFIRKVDVIIISFITKLN